MELLKLNKLKNSVPKSYQSHFKGSVLWKHLIEGLAHLPETEGEEVRKREENAG